MDTGFLVKLHFVIDHCIPYIKILYGFASIPLILIHRNFNSLDLNIPTVHHTPFPWVNFMQTLGCGYEDAFNSAHSEVPPPPGMVYHGKNGKKVYKLSDSMIGNYKYYKELTL